MHTNVKAFTEDNQTDEKTIVKVLRELEFKNEIQARDECNF